MGEEIERASENLRAFMFDRVYLSGSARGEEDKAGLMLTAMYEYFVKDPSVLPQTFKKLIGEYGVEQVVCDYLSSMTDRYAIYKFNSIFVPKGWTYIDED